MSRLIGIILGMVLAVGILGCSKATGPALVERTEPNAEIGVQLQPSQPKAGNPTTLRVEITSDKRPVSDAAVNATFLMGAEPLSKMEEMHQAADLKWDGSRYTGAVTFPMAGQWQATIQGVRNGQNLVVYHGPIEVK